MSGEGMEARGHEGTQEARYATIELVGVMAVCLEIGCTPSRVHAMVRDGRVRSARIDGRLGVHLDDAIAEAKRTGHICMWSGKPC